MPKTLALNGFFPYLREQALAAARSARGYALEQGGGGQARQWLIGGYAVKIGPYNILFS